MKTNTGLIILLILLFTLIFISAFFSASETAMMSLNRYRLRHLARKKNTKAQKILGLLNRTDRLLGVILIGSTVANICASAVATYLVLHYFNHLNLLISTFGLALIILIFAETAPKTLASIYPEKVAFPASSLLSFLLKILYPLVWLINVIANFLLHLLRFPVKEITIEALTLEELRTIVHETKGKISLKYQQMLLRIIDLEKVSVDEIMIPRNEIFGVDLNLSLAQIVEQLVNCNYEFIPLFQDNIDQVLGMLNFRKVLIALQQGTLDKEELINLADEVYFIPEEALVNRQLLNFQQRKVNVGLVVDEYAMVVGLLTMKDVISEIVGEFSADAKLARLVKLESEGSYLVEGGIEVRDLNRLTGWKLPTEGPRTLGGLIIDYLEMIPKNAVAARIAGYSMEVLRISHNRIQLVRIWPPKK